MTDKKIDLTEELLKAKITFSDVKVQCDKCGTFKARSKMFDYGFTCLDCSEYFLAHGKFPSRLRK